MLDDVLPRPIIVAAVKQHAFGIEAVTPGATRFLLIVLDRLGHAGVDDGAHVGFVDAHPECNRGYDDFDVFLDECVLSLQAGAVGQAGVIGGRLVPGFLQSFGQLVDVGATDAIDDRRLVLVAIEHVAYLPHRVGAALDGVEQIGTVKRSDEDLWVEQMKLLHDVVAHVLGGRGRVGVDGDPWKGGLETTQTTVLGAEIVPPHADAMGFIDGDHGNRVLIQETGETVHHQPLGRNIEDLDPVVADGCDDAVLFVMSLAAVDAGSGNAALGECVDLILHQRDERTDHDGQPPQTNGGNLEAE